MELTSAGSESHHSVADFVKCEELGHYVAERHGSVVADNVIWRRSSDECEGDLPERTCEPVTHPQFHLIGERRARALSLPFQPCDLVITQAQIISFLEVHLCLSL